MLEPALRADRENPVPVALEGAIAVLGFEALVDPAAGVEVAPPGPHQDVPLRFRFILTVEVEGEDELRHGAEAADRFGEGVAVAAGEDVLGVVVENAGAQLPDFGEAEEYVEALPLAPRFAGR